MCRLLGMWMLVGAVLAGPAAGQRVVMSGYVGGPEADTLSSAAVTSDNSVILAGTMPGADLQFKPPARVQRGEGNGVILRLSATATRVLCIVRFRGSVDDLDTDAKSNIYATGGFGTVKLDRALVKEIWRSEVGGEGARIAPGPAGGAVILTGRKILVLGLDGKVVKDWQVEAEKALDVACDTKNKLIFVTGSNTKGPEGSRAPVAYAYAYDLEGKQVWKAYDWKREDLGQVGLTAGTRGTCLEMGADGKLYIGGIASGGNAMWGRHSQDLSAKILMNNFDKYQHPYNTGGASIGFVGRMDPKTGETVAGTMLLARGANDRGVSMEPVCLAVDARGRIYAGGKAGASPPVSRGAMGTHFKGGGAFMWAFDPAFNRVFAAKFCLGTTHAITLGRTSIVAVGAGTENLKTVKPLMSEPAGGNGWAVIFKKGR